MRGQRPAPAIRITARQSELLQSYNRKTSISNRDKFRTSIILLASQGLANKVVARQLSASNETVKKWRKRWESSYDQLLEFEKGLNGQGVSDKALLSKMLEMISDLPRSGKPKEITLCEEQQIIALACEKPEDHGIPITHWNREMLAHVAMAKGIVKKISPRYVSEILKKK